MLNKGFTLIELLVVLVIIGLFTSLVILTVTPNSNRNLEREAKRLLHVIELAQDESVMQGVQIGLTIQPDRYFFSGLNETKWVAITSDRQLIEHAFDSSIVVELEVDGDLLDKNSELPAIMILSSGELTQFKLSLSLDDQPNIKYQLFGQENGQLSMISPHD